MSRRTLSRQQTGVLHMLTAMCFILASSPGSARDVVVPDDQWPVAFQADGYAVRLFAPQPEAVDGDRFTARMAVSLVRSGEKNAVFGAIWGEGRMAVDRGTRMATLLRFDVTDVRFPAPLDQESARIRTMLSREIPRHTDPFSIDWLLASLEQERSPADKYLNDAPEIIYTEQPSALVYIDGEPQYVRLERQSEYGDPLYNGVDTDTERVLNTPFLLLRHRKQAHYLYGSGRWYKATDVKGPYDLVSDVPAGLRAIATAVDDAPEVGTTSTTVPRIIVRTTPAALLDLDGPPRMKPLQGTSLLYAENTDKDLFMEVGTQQYYFLASGRWYTTREPRSGAWAYVPGGELPTDFANIPEGSPKDGVLPHVPGTHASREAVRDTYIPQTATVDRATATLEVTYDGDPVFERVEGTNVDLAANASTIVLRINGRFHACDNAVWYDAPSPYGPWSVSTSVPAQVQDIPPSSPAYHTRYAVIYDHDDRVVITGYTPGYLGCFVQDGVVIMGSGFYYRPWPRFWYPRPFTWGFNMYYDPWIGWTFGYGWGWNWFYPSWYSGWYGPTYPWGAWGAWGWWGPCHYHPHWIPAPRPIYYGHRPSLTGASRATATATQTDLYSAVRRDGVKPTTVARDLVEQRTTSIRKEQGTARDHFIDRDGKIYRRNDQRIERYENGNWQRVQPQRTPPPTTSPGDRNRPSPPVRTDPVPQQQPRPVPQGRVPPTPPVRQEAPRHTPFDIQERRDRGDQRVRDYQHYRRTTPPAPQRRVSPQPRQAPSTAPQRGTPAPQRSAPSSPPSRSTPAPSSPQRSQPRRN